MVVHLPLGLLAVDESLQDSNDLVEGRQISGHQLLDLGLVVSQLLVEIGAGRAGAHGGAEEGFDNEGVVGLQGGGVGVTEGGRELFGFAVDVGVEGKAHEVEATAVQQGISKAAFNGGGQEEGEQA